jgi:hypothetical protein
MGSLEKASLYLADLVELEGDDFEEREGEVEVDVVGEDDEADEDEDEGYGLRDQDAARVNLVVDLPSCTASDLEELKAEGVGSQLERTQVEAVVAYCVRLQTCLSVVHQQVKASPCQERAWERHQDLAGAWDW